ncbi:MAG: hypothetical protein IPK16_09115 [Anaerolineales bacterium]|nr:hypothetical protein [Anaerolineales bacterium]
MTIMTVPTKTKRGASLRSASTERMQVKVHIDTEVLAPEIARRRANVWLLETVGNLLGAQNAELILDEPLRWRFDAILGMPDLDHPGTGDLFRVGMIEIDAMTGEVLNPEQLAEELHISAASAVR